MGSYENVPVELQVNVTVFVLRCTSCPFKYCTAVALLPLRDADLLAMDQVEADGRVSPVNHTTSLMPVRKQFLHHTRENAMQECIVYVWQKGNGLPINLLICMSRYGKCMNCRRSIVEAPDKCNIITTIIRKFMRVIVVMILHLCYDMRV